MWGGVNDAPIGVDLVATTQENESVVTENVLIGAKDIDGDTLFISEFGQPQNGVVVENGDGTFTYTPNVGFDGEDQFTYIISDNNGGFDTAIMNIVVQNVNDLIIPISTTQSPAPGNEGMYDGDIENEAAPIVETVVTPEPENIEIIKSPINVIKTMVEDLEQITLESTPSVSVEVVLDNSDVVEEKTEVLEKEVEKDLEKTTEVVEAKDGSASREYSEQVAQKEASGSLASTEQPQLNIEQTIREVDDVEVKDVSNVKQNIAVVQTESAKEDLSVALEDITEEVDGLVDEINSVQENVKQASDDDKEDGETEESSGSMTEDGTKSAAASVTGAWRMIRDIGGVSQKDKKD